MTTIRPARSTVTAILAQVSRSTGVPVEEIVTKGRRGHVIGARWIAMRALRDRRAPLMTISDLLGCAHHASVIHGLRRFDEIAATNRKYRKIRARAAMVGRRSC